VLGFAEWLQSTGLSAWIQATGWVIPTLQSIHIVTIGIVFIAILMTVLRIFGRVHAEEPLGAVWERYSPWLWYGLIVLAFTGVLLVIGEPVREFSAISFWLKMVLLAVAVASAIIFGRRFVPAALGAAPGARFPTSTRAAAIATVALWLAIIFLGRAIAYDFEVWGSWSRAFLS
jgi:uncharacterized membrane protein SirB2